MYYSIDRFEEPMAILEDEQGNMSDILKETLPPNAKEGDVVTYIEGVYLVDEAETRKRKKEMADLMADLLHK